MIEKPLFIPRRTKLAIQVTVYARDRKARVQPGCQGSRTSTSGAIIAEMAVNPHELRINNRERDNRALANLRLESFPSAFR